MQLGGPLTGYGDPDHPVQRHVRGVLSEMGEMDLSSAPVAGDGCGVPVFGMTLAAIALAFARLAELSMLSRKRAEAARRIISAMAAHPYLVGGSDRFDTLVLEGAGGAVLVKGGAEGVCAAAILGRGLGLAVKIDDGAKRASETAMAALLARYREQQGPLRETVIELCRRPVLDTRCLPAGDIRPAPRLAGLTESEIALTTSRFLGRKAKWSNRSGRCVRSFAGSGAIRAGFASRTCRTRRSRPTTCGSP